MTRPPQEPVPRPWHVYILRTRRGSLYTGIAVDVERRFREHISGGARAARYLRAHPAARLEFSQAIGDRSLAARIEHRLKRLPRSAKEAIITARGLRFDVQTGTITPLPGAGEAVAGAAHLSQQENPQ